MAGGTGMRFAPSGYLSQSNFDGNGRDREDLSSFCLPAPLLMCLLWVWTLAQPFGEENGLNYTFRDWSAKEHAISCWDPGPCRG